MQSETHKIIIYSLSDMNGLKRTHPRDGDARVPFSVFTLKGFLNKEPFWHKKRARDGDRTRDLLLGKETLYH